VKELVLVCVGLGRGSAGFSVAVEVEGDAVAEPLAGESAPETSFITPGEFDPDASFLKPGELGPEVIFLLIAGLSRDCDARDCEAMCGLAAFCAPKAASRSGVASLDLDLFSRSRSRGADFPEERLK